MVSFLIGLFFGAFLATLLLAFPEIKAMSGLPGRGYR